MLYCCLWPDALLQDAKGDDNEMATDNALSALVGLIQHHSDVCAADSMVELLVSGLPLKSDAVEAQKVNEWLVQRLEVGDLRHWVWRVVSKPFAEFVDADCCPYLLRISRSGLVADEEVGGGWAGAADVPVLAGHSLVVFAAGWLSSWCKAVWADGLVVRGGMCPVSWSETSLTR